MSNISKGGRGKKAPYKTVMCRTPEPVKHLAEELSAKYRKLVNNYYDPEDPELLAAVTNKSVDEKTAILNALNKFIKIQEQNYGKNGAQKDKEFTLNTRKWDAFREFNEFVKSLE